MALTRAFSRVYPRYSAEQMFSLAADIEAYPSFVPGCQRAQIVSRAGDGTRERLLVENEFGFGPARRFFHTRAEFDPPRGLSIVSRDGPWRLFSMAWRFAPEGAGCRLACEVKLDFQSRVLNLLAPVAAAEVEGQVLAAFERRAEKLFGARRCER
jgi:coenzyme Q-binding protein COQ10